MILKASQRGGAKQLAMHLLNPENEHVTVHQLRGFISDTVTGALQEIHATSRATQCKKFLFSLSLNPPEDANAPIELFEQTVDRIEKKLGLTQQARAIIFHEKNGRRHAHCVWSRIDGIKMKAIKLNYFKKDLNTIAKDIFIEQKWEMPAGFKNSQNRDPRNFTLSEWQQAKRTKQNPKTIKANLQQCWAISDSKTSFSHALNEAGYFLAQGDRRGFVVVDWYGEVYSLSRQLSVNTKDLTARLGEHKHMPTIKAVNLKRTTDLRQLHKQYSQTLAKQHKTERLPYRVEKSTLITKQRKQRSQLNTQQQTRQGEENKARQAKMRHGILGLWDTMTGASRKQKQRNELAAKVALERDRNEAHAMVNEHLSQRQTLKTKFQGLKEKQQQEKNALNTSFVQASIGELEKSALSERFNQCVTTEKAPVITPTTQLEI